MSSVKIRRFKVENCAGPTVQVGGREAKHALRVMRLGVGDTVAVFDGHGGEAVGRITSTNPAGFTVNVQEQVSVPQAKQPGLVLAVAAPKGSRADWLVEKCAELGVGVLCLLRTERGQVMPGLGKLQRWRRKAVEAAKQAGQRTVMTIEPPRTVAEMLAATAGRRILYGDPSCPKMGLLQALRQPRTSISAPEPPVIFIGPEGGLTDKECRAIEAAGGVAVSLGKSILRIETAAVAVAAVWALEGGPEP